MPSDSPIEIGFGTHRELNHRRVHAEFRAKLLQNSLRVRASAVGLQTVSLECHCGASDETHRSILLMKERRGTL